MSVMDLRRQDNPLPWRIKKRYALADKSDKREFVGDGPSRIKTKEKGPSFRESVDEREASAHNPVRQNNRRPSIVPNTDSKTDPLKNALSVVKSLDTVPSDVRSAVLQAIEKKIAETSPAPRISTMRPDLDAKRPRLPELPAGLKWPSESYSDSPEVKRGGGGIVPYLNRVWYPLIKAAPDLVDLRTLREVDPSTAMGINNFKRSGNVLPAHLSIPTKKEMNDRLLASQPGACLENPRMVQMVAARLRRGVPIPS